jgi:hypothetical protein
MRYLIPLLTLLLVAPGVPAAEEQSIVPPDDSAIHQFLTVVPGPGGDELPPRAEVIRQSPPLSARQRKRLETLGVEGEKTIEVVDTTFPGGVARDGRRHGTDAPGSRPPAREAIEAIAAGKGDGGLGFALPGILLLVLGGAIAAGLARRGTR